MERDTGDRVAEPGRPAVDKDLSGHGCPSPGLADAAFSQTYPAVVESVAAIRAAVTHFASQVGAPLSAIEALKLALSEAATNVVVHAYAGADQPGLIEVEATYSVGELCVSVADTGPGLQPGQDRPGLGLGLAIIGELADRVELLQGGDNGLRVVMRFAVPAGTSKPGRD